MRNIAVMGSTGSIGTQTLDIIRSIKDFNLVGISAGKNITLVEEQAREFLPELVVVDDPSDAEMLSERLSGIGIRVSSGMEGLIELAELPSSDVFVTAIVGMIGIRPTLAAVNAGKTIALANKETLVTAGHLIMPLAKQKNVQILPVDSEHSAIFQCLQGTVRDKDGRSPINKLWLTASGGAFRGKNTDDLKNATAADALKHPNWNMGNKVTIDSASLVNKGLEVIEAHWLFDVDYEDIEVVIQPKSIIHSMVEFVDGSVIAQMGAPDMHVPIQYALTYPDRSELKTEKLDFRRIAAIEFEAPDTDTFKGLPLAFEAGRCGGSMPTVFNAANEAAVEKFLNGEIAFLDIYSIIENAMAHHEVIADPSLEDILEIEKSVRMNIK